MHLDNLQIERRSQDFRRLAREPEQRVDAGGKIRSPYDGDAGDDLGDVKLVGVGVAGGAYDKRLAARGAQRRNFRRDRTRAEINDNVALGDGGPKIVALVNLAGDFQFAEVFRARGERLAHAAL